MVMVRAIGLIVILLLSSLLAWADEPRYQNSFLSTNGKYEANLQKDRAWRLIEKATGKELYQFNDYYHDGIWFSSMTLVISDDGRNVVAVNDYAENYGQQDFRKNPEVLFFFRDGKQFKTYRLLDVADPRFMEFSVSHFDWLFSANKLSIVDSKIEFTTFDMNHYIFNTENGALMSKGLDDIFSKGAIFVYGTVRSLGQNHHYEIIAECAIRGNVKKGSRIKFESDKIGWVEGGFDEALILQDGRLIASKGIIFNNCD